MSIVARVSLRLLVLLEIFLLVLRLRGPAFLVRLLTLIEKPWA